MKKNEYVSPDMEIVETKVQYSILAGSEIDEGGPGQTDEEIPGWPGLGGGDGGFTE